MKKNLLGWSLMLAAMLAGPQMFAQNVDMTNLIVNNDFEFIAEGVPMTATLPDGTEYKSWKPKETEEKKNGKTNQSWNQGYDKFYGWECELTELSGSSQGINKDLDPLHGTYGAWISSGDVFPEFFEFSQTIAKENLEAGTYRVEAILGWTKLLTSQRLFANQNVCYPQSEADYEKNQTEGEIATFAGYEKPAADKETKELKVYTTIEAGDSLKIGVRTGCINGKGEKAAKNHGYFKVDYFRLTKVDVDNSDVKNITLSAGNITFDSKVTTYDVTLPQGTREVTPTVELVVEDATVAGAETVNFAESATGTSTVTVTSYDKTTSKTYTINYTVEGWEAPNAVDAIAAENVNCFVSNGMLTVEGVEAYEVYNINGTKVAEVYDNINSRVALNQGIYLIKTPNTGVYKVVVK